MLKAQGTLHLFVGFQTWGTSSFHLRLLAAVGAELLIHEQQSVLCSSLQPSFKLQPSANCRQLHCSVHCSISSCTACQMREEGSDKLSAKDKSAFFAAGKWQHERSFADNGVR